MQQMESPSRALTFTPQHSSTLQRRSINCDVAAANAPEFEFEFEFQFWSSKPISTSTLHSADEIFSNGFILPLKSLLCEPAKPVCEPDEPVMEPGLDLCSDEPSALITRDGSLSSHLILNASRRWTEIFKRSEKKLVDHSNSNSNTSDNNNFAENKVEKVNKKGENNRKNKTGSCSTELNINLWPFSRSRSEGNNTTRSNKKPGLLNRKVSSAPCSRSNSSGQAGVHLGRANPVCQLKRGGSGRRVTPGGTEKKTARKVNVPMCIGYRERLSCRSGGIGTIGGVGPDGGAGGVGNGNMFGLRGLFSKKTGSV